MTSSEHATVARRPVPTTVGAIGVTVFGCGRDEADAFREVAGRFGVTATTTDAPLSEATVELARGNRCISVAHTTPVRASTLRTLASIGVEYVSTRSAGLDHIDVEFARRAGITVEGVAYSPDSVADHTLMLMLMAVRNARSNVTRVEAQDFRLNDARGRELRDLTVGVVGTGRIGSAVIDRLRGFGCHVLAYDRTPKVLADHTGLDDLLRRSDLVTLHTPLTADTFHLLDRRRLERMKRDAFVVNTARGSLIDTESLVDALERGRLAGAALDVVEGEEGVFYADRRGRSLERGPLERLLRLPNVLLTPHTAYYTDHALADTVEQTLRNCRAFERRASWPE